VVKGVNISGMENTDRVNGIAQSSVDQLRLRMKPRRGDRRAAEIDAGNARFNGISWACLERLQSVA
jgi:hypothetical protein